MSEVHLEEHSSPIKTRKQLIIVVLLAFLVPVILIVMLSQLVTTGFDASKDNPALSDEAVAQRARPQVEVAPALDPVAAARHQRSPGPVFLLGLLQQVHQRSHGFITPAPLSQLCIACASARTTKS